jgi:hypothetical protein
MEEKLYKIIAADQSAATITVWYSNDFAPVVIELPIDSDNAVPTGEQLDTYIKGFIPIAYLERLNKIKTNSISNFDSILTLVEPETLVDPMF